MSTSVMAAQEINLNEASVLAHQQIMPPSPFSAKSPRARHGRGKHGGSVGRARASSNTDEREVMITKALTWVLKHGAGERKEEDGIDIHFNQEGWADCGEVLQWPNLSSFKPTLEDLQSLLANNPRNRFSLKLKSSEDDASLASSWLIRAVGPNTIDASTLGKQLTAESDDLPDLVIYATTYTTYAHISSSGALKNTGGGNVSFSTSLPDESDSKAEVLFYIDLRLALANSPLEWYINETGTSITVAGGKSVPKAFWKKVVGRKGDVGTLWEEGEVVRDVPIGVRGKKVGGGKELKGRNGRGKGGRANAFGARKASSDDSE